MISKESLEKFEDIYMKRFGKNLSNQAALESATSLLTLMKAIYRPMTREDYEKLQKRRKETK